MIPNRNELSENRWASPDNIRYNALLWLDRREAHVVYFSEGLSDPALEKPDHWSQGFLLNDADRDGGKLSAKSDFYSTAASACAKVQAFVLSGPSREMAEFVKFLHRHEPETLELLGGIVSLSRLTDQLLVAEARHCLAGR